MPDAACIPTPTEGWPALAGQWLGALVGFRRLNSAMFARVTEHTGLPESSFQVLGYLLHQPGHSAPMSHLARHLEFSTAGITKVTDRLTQQGLLKRHPCPSDRRVVFAVLTADGITAARRAVGVLEQAIRDLVLTHTGDDDFTTLTDIVAKAGTGLPAR